MGTRIKRIKVSQRHGEQRILIMGYAARGAERVLAKVVTKEVKAGAAVARALQDLGVDMTRPPTV